MNRDDDADAVHDCGHRVFVGGNDDYWDRISALQFDMLLAQGLRPNDQFVDIACGSLRAGVKLIPYLEPGHYTGVDKHIELIIYGVSEELGLGLYRDRRPRFLVTDRFDFGRIETPPTCGIAQSLFTHLTAADIALCLRNLRAVAATGCRFFATFFEADEAPPNPAQSHSRKAFRYRRREVEEIGEAAGWSTRYIGDWNHPRDQKLIEFRC